MQSTPGSCRRVAGACCSGRAPLQLSPAPPRRLGLQERSFRLRPPTPCLRRLLLSAACAPAELRGAAARTGADAQDCTVKTYDVVALSNLCVDIVLEVPQLPPEDTTTRQQLLAELTASELAEDDTWEVGGNANFMISAARLGLVVASIGHVNEDRFGAFLSRVLREEDVQRVERVQEGSTAATDTLLCFVLVGPDAQHAFCSRYDFGPWPLLDHVTELPESSMQLLRDTRAVYVNGFCFDELRADTVIDAMREAANAGSAVFFDPGPRAWTMLDGERRRAMEGVLDTADVVLVTREEGEALTGESTSERIAEVFFRRAGNERLQWVVVKDGAEGATLFTRDGSFFASGFSVDVEDTVGCGDSFAAAIVLGYIYKHDITTTLKLANAVGAATATRRGAGRNVGHPETVESLLSGDEGCPDAHTLLLKSRDGSLDSNDW